MEKNDRADYFSWTDKDQVTIKTIQCKECRYFQIKDVLTCSQYKERKPHGVLRCEQKCPKFERSEEKRKFYDSLFGGLLGACIADALGVPVEFKSRSYLRIDPVEGMIGYGTYNQPPGSWSDDSSMTFCLVDSLCDHYQLEDIGEKFINWYQDSLWTPYDNVFDIGNATAEAINKLINGSDVRNSGNKHERSNGNGSLMRILPLAFFYFKNENVDIMNIVKEVSCITHAHIRSVISCQLYVLFAISLIKGKDKDAALSAAIEGIVQLYKSSIYEDELTHFNRILTGKLLTLKENSIKSTGYVIDTLEASIWVFMTTGSYTEAVLKAVNLGDDTDTVGAITGGLAGLYYGVKSLPDSWLETIARKDDIIHLLDEFYQSLL